MKSRALRVSAFSLMSVFVYAAPNYNNGNGTILSEFENNGIKTTVRKCKQTVCIWKKVQVKDVFGLGGKKVFLLHDFEEGTRDAQEFHTIRAMSEERGNH